MILGRIVGWLFLALALLAGSAKVAVSLRAGRFTSLPLEQFWRDLNSATLESTQSWARDIAPWLWDPGMTTILQMPAWPMLLGLAAVILWLFHAPAPAAPSRPQVIGGAPRHMRG